MDTIAALTKQFGIQVAPTVEENKIEHTSSPVTQLKNFIPSSSAILASLVEQPYCKLLLSKFASTTSSAQSILQNKEKLDNSL